MNPSIITYIATLVAGVLFIVFRQDTNIIDTLTFIAALIFIVPGVVNFIVGVRNLRRPQRSFFTTFGLMLVSAGAVVLGALMLFIPGFFANYVAVTLGIVLVLCGIYQLVLVLRGAGESRERWFAVVPVLVVAAGVVVMILQADRITPTLWIATGCVLIAYSINGFVAMRMLTGKVRDKNTTVVVR